MDNNVLVWQCIFFIFYIHIKYVCILCNNIIDRLPVCLLLYVLIEQLVDIHGQQFRSLQDPCLSNSTTSNESL